MKTSRALLIIGAITGVFSALVTLVATANGYFAHGHDPRYLFNLVAALVGLALSLLLLRGSRLAALGLIVLFVVPKLFYPAELRHLTGPTFLVILALLSCGVLGTLLGRRQSVAGSA